MHFKNLKEQILKLLKTRQGKNAMTFGIFLIISTVFWFLMTLNDEVQRDYIIPVDIVDVPADVTLLSSDNPSLNISVKDKGRNLLKFDWGKGPKLKIKFSDFNITDDGRLILTEQSVKTIVREMFGNSTQIAFMHPDSLSLRFTSLPGVKLPVYPNIDVQASPRHIVHGKVIVSPDSVTLYAPQGIPSNIVSIQTDAIAARGLSDTTTYQLALEVPNGMRVIPSKVDVTIPVEPLISKQVQVEIKSIHVPNGFTLLPFPAVVELNYLLPMSEYNNEDFTPTAKIDYLDISHDSPTIPVKAGHLPDYIKSIAVTPKEVEFVVERPVIPQQ